MDDLTLAELFVARAKLQKQIIEIENEIADVVLQRGETVEIAGVRATYYNRSQPVDWKQTAELYKACNPDAPDIPTKTSVSYQYKDFCEMVDVPTESLVYSTLKPARVGFSINK